MENAHQTRLIVEFINKILCNLATFLFLQDSALFALDSNEQVLTNYVEKLRESEVSDHPERVISRWMSEVLICQCSDAFQHYISQVLLQILIRYPKHLTKANNSMRGSTDSKVDLHEILEAGTMEEFIRRYADQKVDELGYAGLPKIIEYFNSRLGLKFDTTIPEFQTAVEYIEVRNIIVHNAGCVSRLYLQRVKNTNLKLGELYPLTSEYATNGGLCLGKVAAQLDSLIVTKFKLN